MFSPIAKFSSKTSLRKVKFHAPKHATFYIHRYGSSDNFFGGNLESALKSTVKAPTKITSRCHDHIARGLASQQHERFICCVSCTETANWMDDSLNDKVNMDSTQWRSRMRIADDSYSIATEKPMDWELRTLVFYLSHQGDHLNTQIPGFVPHKYDVNTTDIIQNFFIFMFLNHVIT